MIKANEVHLIMHDISNYFQKIFERKNIMKRITLTALILILKASIANAQSGTVSCGGDASGSGGTVAYSIGQVSYLNNVGDSGKADEGIQHPFEIFTIGIDEEANLDFTVDIFPNPTINNLTLTVTDFKSENLSYKLYDLKGRILERRIISA